MTRPDGRPRTDINKILQWSHAFDGKGADMARTERVMIGATEIEGSVSRDLDRPIAGFPVYLSPSHDAVDDGA